MGRVFIVWYEACGWLYNIGDKEINKHLCVFEHHSDRIPRSSGKHHHHRSESLLPYSM